MARINLLPWRAERRKQREREFYMMLAATAVSAVLVSATARLPAARGAKSAAQRSASA